MATAAGCLDEDLFNDVLKGHKITGMAKDSKTFPSRLRSPTMTVEALNGSAVWTRRSIIGSIRSSGDEGLDRELFDETLSDKSKGWLDGPYSETEVSSMLGEDWVVSRRFGIYQGEKLRSIDDLSESFVNSTYGSFESIDLGGVDEVAAVCKAFMDAVADDGAVEVDLGYKVLKGHLHKSLTVEEARSLVGRSLDLKSAYKQQAIHPSSYKQSVTAVFNPDTKSCS